MTQLDADIRANTTIRDMSDADCDRVAGIINQYATVEVLLWRTAADIRRNLSGFIVAEWRDKIIGCAAIRDYGNGLYELRSLAVLPEFCGHGIGSLLTHGCIDLARRRGGARIFALTRRSAFFAHLGFQLAGKELFPQKVWTDCQQCWKRHRCDEVAMLVDLQSPAEVGESAGAASLPGSIPGLAALGTATTDSSVPSSGPSPGAPPSADPPASSP